jgi:hypothetical protein
MLTRALQHSSKLALSIQYDGFLDVQIMMPIFSKNLEMGENQGIIEFRVSLLFLGTWKKTKS